MEPGADHAASVLGVGLEDASEGPERLSESGLGVVRPVLAWREHGGNVGAASVEPSDDNVFLPREVVEHCRAGYVGALADVLHGGDCIAACAEQRGRTLDDSVPGLEGLAGTPTGWT